jgi:D-arabinose 1-dehydrogenase-like Zn-dependent alcohol dehydrogenase
MQALAYGVDSAEGKFRQMEITRRNVGENDVHIEIIYSGICHSDIHQVKNEWYGSNYPMVPGHEILGRVVAVGNKVGIFFCLSHCEGNKIQEGRSWWHRLYGRFLQRMPQLQIPRRTILC